MAKCCFWVLAQLFVAPVEIEVADGPVDADGLPVELPTAGQAFVTHKAVAVERTFALSARPRANAPTGSGLLQGAPAAVAQR